MSNSINIPSQLELTSKFGLSLLLLAAIVLTLSLRIPINEWAITHWAFSYDGEFLKRGFVGTVLLLISPTWTIQDLTIISIGLASLTTFTLLCVALRFTPNTKQAKILLTYLIIAPFTIQHIGFDLSRFDQFGLLFLGIFLLLLNSRYLPLSYLFIPIGILIHETFVFLFLPTYLSFILIKYRANNKLIATHTITLVSLSLPIFIFVLLFGGSNSHTIDEINTLVSRTLVPNYDPDSALIFFRSISDNISITMDLLFSERMIRNLFRFSVVLAPFLFIAYKLWKLVLNNLKPEERIYLYIALTAQASCFILFFLGFDFFRWLAALFTCNMLLLIYCLSTWQHWSEVKQLFSTHKKTLYYIAITSLLSGPLSVMAPFKEPLFLFNNAFDLAKHLF